MASSSLQLVSETRRCKSCAEDLPLSSYRTSTVKGKLSYRSTCRDCVNTNRRGPVKDLTVKICCHCNQTFPISEFYPIHKTGYRSSTCHACRAKEGQERRWGEERPQQRFYQYRASAKKKGQDFSLTLRQFEVLIRKPCLYCGDIPDPIALGGIDRVDNGKGYTAGNSVPCCVICNKMKKAFPVADFLNRIRRIASRSENILKMLSSKAGEER